MEKSQIDLEAIVTENADRIVEKVWAGQAEVQDGSPFITLDQALNETNTESDQ